MRQAMMQAARRWSESERFTAYHEAGHAVMAQLCGQQVTRVEIVGEADHTGSVDSLRFPADSALDDGSGAIEDRLRCTLAGMVAEAMVSGREDWDEKSEDLDLAVRLAMQLVDDCEAVLPLLEEYRGDIEGELRNQWVAVELLAIELLHKKSLTGSEVRRLLLSLLA
jgi:ATP-dependent Zn protease